MKKYLIILCSLLLTACLVSEKDMPAPTPAPVETEEEMGSFELTLTGERQTRATSTVITKEEADNFLITIYKGSDVYRETARLKDINTRLSAGYGYKIFAESCSETEAITTNYGWGQRRYAGMSAPFAVKAGQTTPVSVGCSVANAGVEVVFDESVPAYFTTSYDITITEGNRTIVFDAITGGTQVGGVINQGEVAYFNVDDEGHHTITYTINAVGPKTLTKTGTLELTKAKISRIKLNYERSNFNFVIFLEEQEIFLEDYINISDDDIKVDDGNTETSTSHDNFTEDNTNVDIGTYGQN
ncbi:MAG: DUF4493 domain-containing protein [Bacteroidaceae bacterium]|nr:DUF4493 domain-containing protein [Bacteroidaceae bacterium]